MKVVSNGQHIQQRRKSVPRSTVAPVVSSSLGLDDFDDDDDDEPEATTILANTDILVPNSVDEEELMFRRALELSLKETKMNAAKPTEVKSSKLGLDDFDMDEGILGKTVSKPVAKTLKKSVQNSATYLGK